MRSAAFRAYKERFVAATRAVLAKNGTDEALSEAAFPAYANPNPLISFLFWERVRVVMKQLERVGKLDTVLDFGCGGGVMLPFLSGLARRVIACDVTFAPLEAMRPHIPLPGNVELLLVRESEDPPLEAGQLDAIVALDVLEHVPDLPRAVGALWRGLRPGGQLVASGPTENLVYKIGRVIAGKDYTGHYHESNVYDIRSAMAAHARVSTLATLFYPLPLFKVYRAIAPAA